MQKLRCAVIGAGNIGCYHIQTIHDLSDELILVAVCDIRKEVKDEFQDIPFNFYDNYLEMIESEKLDMVVISVPTNLHYKIAKNCILKGINLLVEKPICQTLEQAEEISSLAKEFETGLFVGHNERFNPAVVKAKEIIASGQVGDIKKIIAFRLGGLPKRIKGNDVALDLAIHDIDVCNYLIEDLPYESSFKKSSVKLIGQNDTVEFSLKYKKVQAELEATWASPVKKRKMEIFGTEGYIELDYISQRVHLYEYTENNHKRSAIEVEYEHSLKLQIKHYIRALVEKEEISCQHALDALSLVLNSKGKVLAYESA